MIVSFMALRIMPYGAIQAAAPRILRRAATESAPIRASRSWAAALCAAVLLSPRPQIWLTVTLVIRLLALGVIFAVNAS